MTAREVIEAKPERYFVDSRCGCVAVRDRTLTDPDYPGLHEDTTGVVRYWHGRIVEGEPCPTCGHVASGSWKVSAHDKAQAVLLCAELNAKQRVNELESR